VIRWPRLKRAKRSYLSKDIRKKTVQKFFEKHKVDWAGLAGLALGAIQVIQNALP